MANQFSTGVRNAIVDIIETTIGTSPTMEIRTGAMPANAAAAATGTVIATIIMPSDWLGAAVGGVKTMLGTWQDASADATGTAGYFRIITAGTCHHQGTATATGGGGDMTIDNPALVAGQVFNVTSFSYTAGGA